MSRHWRPLFDGLEASGRFRRDSCLGRIFHPGTVSYREIAATDSLHLSVRPDNRVSVHIDRVSPLLVRAGRRCRYSLWPVLVHNVVVLGEAVARRVRGQPGRHACHLDCEIVWVPDDEREGRSDSAAAHAA